MNDKQKGLSYVEEEEAEYSLVGHDVEDVARLRVDDGETMDPVRNKRVNGVKEGRVGTNTLELLVLLLKYACE